MSLLSALRALQTVQESIFIPEDVRDTIEGLTIEGAKIQKAYLLLPPENDGLATVPCFQNIYTATQILRSSGLLETVYDVRMQLFIRDANADRACLIATAFWDAINAKFDTVDGMTVLGSISHSNLTGGSPTLVGWERSGGPFVGLDLHLEIFDKVVSSR